MSITYSLALIRSMERTPTHKDCYKFMDELGIEVQSGKSGSRGASDDFRANISADGEVETDINIL